jgi:hypothetical protein
VWRYAVGGSVVSSPVYGGGVLLVGSTDGRICGLALTALEIERFEQQRGGELRDGDESHASHSQ